MTEQHDLDELVAAGIDACVEHELRQLFAVARAPGAADELAAEAAVVASMSDIVHRQTTTGHVTPRRPPLRRVVGSRTAKVTMITGFVVVLTSAAVAAGVVPQPVQSVFDRAARIASRQNAERDEPGAAVVNDPEPRAIAETTEVPDAIVPTTVAASIAVDRETDAHALCGMWTTSIRSGLELEAAAKRALVAMAARVGTAVERLCGPAVSTPAESVPSAQETPSAEAVLPPTVDTTVPTTDAPAPASDGTPQSRPTLPPQANGNGPPVSEPGPADKGNDAATTGTPNANANANANGSANANGGNQNANANAGGTDANANANSNANGAGSDRNANGGNQNSNGGNGDG
jgi:hypothetical protein